MTNASENTLKNNGLSKKAYTIAFSTQIKSAEVQNYAISDLQKILPGIEKKLTELGQEKCTYTYKNALIEALSCIAHRLDGKLDKELGALSSDAEVAITKKLAEEAALCFQGLHDRAQEITRSFQRPQNFESILQLVRENLIRNLSSRLTNEVHATNTIVNIAAQKLPLGVRPGNQHDDYFGDLLPQDIKDALISTFNEEYTPYHIPFLICDFLKDPLLLPPSVCTESSNTEITQGDIEKALGVLNTYLPSIPEEFSRDCQYILMHENEETCAFTGVNWPAIQKEIFQKIKKDYCESPTTVAPTDLCELAIALQFKEKPGNSIIEKLIAEFKKDIPNHFPVLMKKLPHYPVAYRMLFQEKFIFSNILPLIKFAKLPDHALKILPTMKLLSIYFPKVSTSSCKNNADRLKKLQQIILEKIDSPSDRLTEKYFDLLRLFIIKNRAEMSVFFETAEKAKPHFYYHWMHALCRATEKNPNTASVIADALSDWIKQANSANIHALITELLQTATEGPDKGKNGFYWWMGALYNAAENPQIASEIIKALSNFIEKTDANQIHAVITGLSQTVAEGPNKGINGFCWWMAALAQAAGNPQIAPEIIKALSHFITKTNGNPNYIHALITGLSQTAAEGPNKGINSFYWWMGALCQAAENPQIASEIIKALSHFITKTNSNHIHALITGLSQTAAEGPNKGRNGFYWWMAALGFAAKYNPQAAPNIIKALSDFIAKTDDNANHIHALITGLSQTAAEGPNKGRNSFYWWMAALDRATENNPQTASEIIKALSDFIAKTDDNANHIHALITGLSQTAKEEGPNKGKNGFYWWMAALCQAATKNPQTASDIIKALSDFIAKTDADYIPALITGLSQAAAEGPDKGENGFYLWMVALCQAAEKNPQTVPDILKALSDLITKTDADHIPALIIGLSQATAKDRDKGKNGFYWWMDALALATKQNTDAAPEIAVVLSDLIEKANPDDIINILKKISTHPSHPAKAAVFLQLIKTGCQPGREKNIQIGGQLLKYFNSKKQLALLNQACLWETILNSSSWSLPPLSPLIMQFTNNHQQKKWGFFSETACFPTEFKYGEKIKVFYDNLFDHLTQATNIAEFVNNLCAPGSAFLASARSKEYLKAYCLAKMKKEGRSFYTQHLAAGTPLGQLIDAQRGIIHTTRTKTRQSLAEYCSQLSVCATSHGNRRSFIW
jgi:hypothetical protein